jgi:hypothetical protein
LNRKWISIFLQISLDLFGNTLNVKNIFLRLDTKILKYVKTKT